MRTTLQADWVGPDYYMRKLDSELLDIFFACDEESAHEALGEIEEPILDSAAVLHRQVRKEVRCETLEVTDPIERYNAMRPATFYYKPDIDMRASLLLSVYQEANSATRLSFRVDSGIETLVVEEARRVSEPVRWETTQ